jgi:ABC-type sulfate/molybdate transport systems ATPase subunit
MPRLIARRSDALDVARALCTRLLPGIDPSRLAGRLSGGEKQAAALARALAWPGDLLLADEPFAALAAPMRGRLRQVLREELGSRALLLVTHAAEDAADLCDRMVRVNDGRLVEEPGAL